MNQHIDYKVTMEFEIDSMKECYQIVNISGMYVNIVKIMRPTLRWVERMRQNQTYEIMIDFQIDEISARIFHTLF